MTELLFGFNLTFAAKRWPETDAWAQLVASMGIHHVQYSFDLWDPEIGSDLSACDKIRDRAEHHNVSISSTFPARASTPRTCSRTLTRLPVSEPRRGTSERFKHRDAWELGPQAASWGR